MTPQSYFSYSGLMKTRLEARDVGRNLELWLDLKKVWWFILTTLKLWRIFFGQELTVGSVVAVLFSYELGAEGAAVCCWISFGVWQKRTASSARSERPGRCSPCSENADIHSPRVEILDRYCVRLAAGGSGSGRELQWQCRRSPAAC